MFGEQSTLITILLGFILLLVVVWKTSKYLACRNQEELVEVVLEYEQLKKAGLISNKDRADVELNGGGAILDKMKAKVAHAKNNAKQKMKNKLADAKESAAQSLEQLSINRQNKKLLKKNEKIQMEIAKHEAEIRRLQAKLDRNGMRAEQNTERQEALDQRHSDYANAKLERMNAEMDAQIEFENEQSNLF